MDIFYNYRCEFGHQWLVRRANNKPEELSETYCPAGHVAVTCNPEVPADGIQILIKPAKRIVDNITNQTILDDQYWIVLLDKKGEQIAESSITYTWEKALTKLNVIKGKTEEEALKWWVKIAL